MAAWAPAALLSRAREQGLSMLAITDHDTMAGYLAVQHDSTPALRLVSGVELSCTWGNYLIHIVGLDCDPQHPVLLQGLQQQQQARADRGALIGAALARRGLDCYALAQQLAGDSELGRPHFAQALVALGHVSSVAQAFKRYLGPGKIGDIRLTWPALATVVDWIRQSGGVAVLAHPFHYPLSATKRRGLLADFQAAGGLALEVLSGKQDQAQTAQLVAWCEQLDLYASAGSDFHHPDTGWCELGCQGPLPDRCRPVWELFAA